MDAIDLSSQYPAHLSEHRLDLTAIPARVESIISPVDPTVIEESSASVDRILFYETLDAALRRHRRERHSFALLLLTLDGSSGLTSECGTDLHEEILKATEVRLKSGVRRTDKVARYGNNEFAIILKQIVGRTNAEGVIARIRHSIGQPMPVHGHQFALSTRIAYAHYPHDGIDSMGLLRQANLQLHRT